jgi:hypothetical protein
MFKYVVTSYLKKACFEKCIFGNFWKLFRCDCSNKLETIVTSGVLHKLEQITSYYGHKFIYLFCLFYHGTEKKKYTHFRLNFI